MDSEEVIASPHERMTYLVRSATNPRKRYRCDLTAQGGFGFCDCMDFGTRRWPNIKPGAEMGTSAVLCKHLTKARNYFLNGLLKRLAEEEEKP